MNLLTFDPNGASESDLKAAQTELAAKRFYGDLIDGQFQTLSEAALGGYRAACTQCIVELALTQVGMHEVPHGSNSGTTIQMYQRETSLGGTGWSWCAAFQCWLVARLQACQPEKFGHFQRPTTAAAFGFADWGRTVGGAVFAPGSLRYQPQRGDFVVYTFSHIGLLSHLVDASHFTAVEGNTNDDGSADGEAVFNHPRRLNSVRWFVRLPSNQ